MITASTEDGFALELDEEAMNNAELMDAIADLQDSDVLALGRAVRLLIGKDNVKKLYDHLRTKDGRVPIEALSTAFDELINSFNAGKNSSSSPN